MIVYRLDFVNTKVNEPNELHFLGYFSTLNNARKALNKYVKMPGFEDKPTHFEIIEFMNIQDEHLSFLYDVNIYYHSEDFSTEHTTFLGVYSSEIKCVEVLNRYLTMNINNKIFKELECETYINRHKLDYFNMSEGFETVK